jgi:hypothetical protein
MQRWEYCTIGPFKGPAEGDVPRLVQFTREGPKTIRLDKPLGIGEAGTISQAIARLGDEGWEMVGCGNVGQVLHILYFKRPKPANQEVG